MGNVLASAVITFCAVLSFTACGIGAIYVALSIEITLYREISCAALLSIVVLKTILPPLFDGFWLQNRFLAVTSVTFWVGLCAYSSGAAILTMAQSGKFAVAWLPLLAAGWVLVELAGAILPAVALMAWRTSSEHRIANQAHSEAAGSGGSSGASRPNSMAPRVPVDSRPGEWQRPPAHTDPFADVSEVLDQALSPGSPPKLTGVHRSDPMTVFTNMKALARHAGCSKSQAHRQLQRLHAAGRFQVRPTSKGTYIGRLPVQPLETASNASLGLSGSLPGHSGPAEPPSADSQPGPSKAGDPSPSSPRQASVSWELDGTQTPNVDCDLRFPLARSWQHFSWYWYVQPP